MVKPLQIARFLLVAVVLAAPLPVLAEVALVHKPPAYAPTDKQLDLDFRVEPASELHSAAVMFRALDGGPWQRAPVELSSSGVWRATVPAPMLTDPGVAYYVVAVDRSGVEVLQFASPDQPHPVYVRGSTLDVQERAALLELNGLRSTLSLSGEWVDYRLLGATAGTAADFGPRYTDFQISYRNWLLRGVEYVEAGVGRLRGTGELNLSTLDTAGQKVQVGLDRGWAEIGFRASEFVGLAGRLVLGGDEETFRVGVAGVLRIGAPQRTRVVFEASATSGFGYHVQGAFHLATVPRWPMSFEVTLTNEPNAGRSSGERARMRIGHEFSPGTTVGLMASYQALTGDDHGLGAGLETAFHF